MGLLLVACIGLLLTAVVELKMTAWVGLFNDSVASTPIDSETVFALESTKRTDSRY